MRRLCFVEIYFGLTLRNLSKEVTIITPATYRAIAVCQALY